MARLIVQIDGKQIADLPLDQDQSYVLGRGQGADIKLPANRGVSREHLRLQFEDGYWTLRLTARYGQLKVDDTAVSEVRLDREMTVHSSPMELTFKPDPKAEMSSSSEVAPSPKMDETASKTLVVPTDPAPVFEEGTQVGSVSYVPYLRILNRQSGKEELIKLEGSAWTLGRDSSCDISLEDGRASRRHIQITSKQNSFYIKDLKSANGTTLNDEPLEANEELELASGDQILLGNTSLTFELRDPSFAHQSPYGAVTPVGGDLDTTFQDLSRHRISLRKLDWQKHKVRIAIGLVLPLLLYGLFLEPDAPAPTPQSRGGESHLSSQGVSFEQLPPEKQRAVRDGFNLIKNLYVQGKYELCISEIVKLHEVVPQYENSQELMVFCKNGAELALKERELERQKEVAAENEKFIQTVVTECQSQITSSITVEQVRACLQPAIERDPSHPMISQLESQAESMEAARLASEKRQQASEQRRSQGLRLLARARQLKSSGQIPAAINAYEDFIRGNYPLDTKVISESERDLASLKMSLNKVIERQLSSCQEKFKSQDYKGSVLACNDVLKLQSKNSDAIALKSKAMNELKRELKSAYEDSVIEESMGNVDGAKERWRQIMNRSLPQEDYYEKAKKKLQRYGMEGM